jgi:H+/Cl- antiporter ClcA
MDILHQKKFKLFLQLIIGLAIFTGAVAIVTFVLYAGARMKEKESKEKLFLKLHYTSLFILFLLGVIFIFFMVETET